MRIPEKSISAIIIVAIISLFGIGIIQLNWIRSAVYLKESIFLEQAGEILKQNQQFQNLNENFVPHKESEQLEQLKSHLTSDFKENSLYHDFSVAIENCPFANASIQNNDNSKRDSKQYLYVDQAIGSTCNAAHQHLVLRFKKSFSMNFWLLKWPILSSLVFFFLLLIAFISSILLLLKHKKVSQVKTDFINMLTHEIKTPLASIDLSAKTVIKQISKESPASAKTLLTLISQESKRLEEQLSKVLLMSSMNTDDYVMQKEKINLNEVITKVIDRLTVISDQKQVSISLDNIKEVPMILGDKTQFFSMIYNLIENAIKHGHAKLCIEISTTYRSNYVFLKICDNGPGIQKIDLNKIFDPFYSSKNATSSNGFGLGLSLVNHIVKSHNGQIDVSSKIDYGTSFNIKLPICTT